MMNALKHWSVRKAALAMLAVFSLTLSPASPLVANQSVHAATVSGITTKSALVTAIASATAGDTLVLGSDIIVDTSAVNIAKNVTIDGNGYTVTVPNRGVLDDGTNSTSASNWSVFTFTTGATGATIRNMTIKGGNASTGAVNVAAGLTVTIQSCTISNSRNNFGGGGGIKNSGTLYLRDSNVIRNSANYGGGFQNSGTIFIDRSSFTENRSESGSGGGGAGENTGGGAVLYVNNSTFANNVSSEIGGAINNYQGTLYAVNSTFTGNVTVASSTYGGAIGKNGGTVKIASSLFAYNYSLSGGTSTAPSAFQLDDIDYGAVTLAYSMYHGVVQSGSTKVQDVQYTGAADGSNDTIFSGGTLAKVTNGTGAQVGTATVFRPALTAVNGHTVVAIRAGSLPIGIGTPTYFGTSTARLSYYDRLAATPAWVSLFGAATSADLVTTDQIGVTKSSTTPTVGAVESGGTALYIVKSISTADGTVDGGASIYGNTYSSGASVTVTALPNAGKVFSKWQVVVGTGASVDVTANPYTFTVSANTTLTPVFATAAVNTYTVSYSANNATAGSPPSAQTFTAGGSALTASTNSGSLARTGYSFGGWSTTASGSGTIYAAGSGTFTPGANMTLYAYWVPPAAPSITVPSATYAFTTGDSVTITPSNTGGAATSWSISPAAPAGMSFGTSTGVLTGSPTTAQASTSYTITATNVSGSATATFAVAIADPVVVSTIYTVTYNYNSATGGASVPSAAFTVGGSALTLPTPTRTGYTFGGWYSDAPFTNQVGGAGSSYSPSADETLYAKWSANRLVVTYETNGGSPISNTATGSGGSIANAPAVSTKTGYDLVGWYSDSALTVPVTFPYIHGQVTNFTLYAKWALATYVVTFEYNSATGGNSAGTASYTYLGTPVTLPTPTRNGYVFAGWYAEAGLSTLVGGAADSFTTTSHTTLYAKWTPNNLVVTYNSNGGSAVSAGSTTSGAIINSAPSAPTKAGYIFGGWYSDSQLTNPASFPYQHNQIANFTLYARWTSGTYTVTYNYNSATGGNGVTADSFTTGGSEITLPTPSRTNFVFAGWYDALSGGSVVGAAGSNFSTTASVTLYARWQQASLSGFNPGDLVAVGVISASDLIDASFGATTNGSMVQVSVPAGALANGTQITMNLLTNFTHAQNILTDAHNYVLSLVVSWLAPDGTVPTTAAGKPITMTISNSSIRRGSAIYVLMKGTATLVGRATVDGQAVVSITDDPEIIIAGTRPYEVSAVTASDGEDGSSTISWSAPTIDGGSPITGYTVTTTGGLTCTTTTTSCRITGLTNGTAYAFSVIATNSLGQSSAITSASITPVGSVVVTPPVTTPVTPPVTTPVTPPVTTPVEPPVVTPPVVIPPVVTPTKPVVPVSNKTISLTSSSIGQKLTAAQISSLKALKATKGFTVTVFTRAMLDSSSKSSMTSIANRVKGAISAAFKKLTTKISIAGQSKVACKSTSGVCIAIKATK
jgi:uncharacterized repeat protein (TIGR02543 family)